MIQFSEEDVIAHRREERLDIINAIRDKIEAEINGLYKHTTVSGLIDYSGLFEFLDKLEDEE